jgi:hypothetical protein
LILYPYYTPTKATKQAKFDDLKNSLARCTKKEYNNREKLPLEDVFE